MLFHGDVRRTCKRAERVDSGMDDYAGEQAPAAVKNRDQQKAYRNRKADLAQIVDQIHTAAVEQIDNMSYAKGQTGNDDCRLDIVLCDSLKQKPPEDHFLQESNAEHTHDTANRFRRGIIKRDAVPKVSRRQENKRRII